MSPCLSPKNGKCSNCQPPMTDNLIFALNAVERLFSSLVCGNLVKGRKVLTSFEVGALRGLF